MNGTWKICGSRPLAAKREWGPTAAPTFEIFKSNAVSGALRFEGTNEVGPRYQYDLNKVDFVPQNAVNPLSEEWGTLELQGEAAKDAGSFGTVTLLGEEASST